MKSLLASLSFVSALALASCSAIADGIVTGAISANADEVVAASIAKPMPGDSHGIMTEIQPARPGDEERAAQLAADITRGIAKWKDIEVAKKDGYEFFPAVPPPHLHIVHLVNRRFSKLEGKRFNPDKPGSLLYERAGEGWKLIGAMITAPVEATVEDLDARVPLSVAQYHLHQNICVPKPIWDGGAWARLDDHGTPVFGPESPIATEAACDAVDGRILETVFGWMAHAYVFTGDPADTWNAMYGHGAGGTSGSDDGH